MTTCLLSNADLKTTIIFVTHSVFESVNLATHRGHVRPGPVIDEIAINAPDARGADFRMSAAFADQAKQVSAALRDAMAMAVAQ